MLLIWFLSGCVVGLQLGSIVEHGIASTIQRTTADPLQALQHFAVFGLMALLLTATWRIPRTFLIGTITTTPVGSLFGGIVYSGLDLLPAGLLRLKMFAYSGPPTVQDWIVLACLIAVLVVASVECEAAIGRFQRHRKQI
jgi:hypothetical protein